MGDFEVEEGGPTTLRKAANIQQSVKLSKFEVYTTHTIRDSFHTSSKDFHSLLERDKKADNFFHSETQFLQIKGLKVPDYVKTNEELLAWAVIQRDNKTEAVVKKAFDDNAPSLIIRNFDDAMKHARNAHKDFEQLIEDPLDQYRKNPVKKNEQPVVSGIQDYCKIYGLDSRKLAQDLDAVYGTNFAPLIIAAVRASTPKISARVAPLQTPLGLQLMAIRSYVEGLKSDEIKKEQDAERRKAMKKSQSEKENGEVEQERRKTAELQKKVSENGESIESLTKSDRFKELYHDYGIAELTAAGVAPTKTLDAIFGRGTDTYKFDEMDGKMQAALLRAYRSSLTDVSGARRF